MKKTRKEFIKFTQTLWINEITSDDTGSLFFQYLKDVLELDKIYFNTKNKYDILYKELKIEKNTKINILISILLILTIIFNLLNIFYLFNK